MQETDSLDRHAERPTAPSKPETTHHDTKRIRYHLYRAALVRWVDALFYEPGNARRNHIRIYELIVRPLCGIGEDTFRNYLHYSPEKLLGYEISEELKALLTLYANSRKALTPKQTARYLLRLAELTAQADAQAKDAKQGLSEDTLIRNIANKQL